MSRPLFLPLLASSLLLACSAGERRPLVGASESPTDKLEAVQVLAGSGAQEASLTSVGIALPAPVALASERLHHLLKLNERIYSGSLPEGDEAFAELAALGIKTVVAVDGARPDLVTAARHGLHYLHVPIGYEGIDEQAAAAYVRLVGEAEGPFYFHCHHGRHRGPAAAAVALRAATGCDTASAEAVLTAAGTSHDYPGLWRDVAAWTPPDPGMVLPELHEVAVVADFTAGMAALDRDWDSLKALRAADWTTPASHPDLDLRRSATAFAEHFADSTGAIPAEQLGDPILLEQLQRALAQAERLQHQADQASQPPSSVQAAAMEETFRELRSSCKDCHRDYRNQ